MLLKCWLAEPEDRPSFQDLSSFIADILNTNSPSQQNKNTQYQRDVTKNIPTDYLSMGGLSTISDEEEYLEPDQNSDCDVEVNGNQLGHQGHQVPLGEVHFVDRHDVYV